MKVQHLVLILSISIFTFSLAVSANEKMYRSFSKEGEIIPRNSDFIGVFNEPNSFRIKKDILILSRPSFAASAEITLRAGSLQIGEEKISYADYLACYNHLTCKKKISKIDFLVKDDNSLLLKIDDYENGYAVIHDKNKAYYFKLDNEKINSLTGLWRTFVFPSEKNKKVDELFQRTPFLKDFLGEIALCAQKKSVDCLKENSTDEVSKYIVQRLQERGVAEDKVLCEKYKKYFNDLGDTSESIPPELREKGDVMNKSSWESILKATKMNLDDSQVSFVIKNLDNDIEVIIRNRLPKKMVCWSDEDLLLKMQRINGKWKLIEFMPYHEDKEGLD